METRKDDGLDTWFEITICWAESGETLTRQGNLYFMEGYLSGIKMELVTRVHVIRIPNPRKPKGTGDPFS